MGKIERWKCDLCGERADHLSEFWAHVSYKTSVYLGDDGTERLKFTKVLCRSCRRIMHGLLAEIKPSKRNAKRLLEFIRSMAEEST